MIEELDDSSYFLNSLVLDTHDFSTINFWGKNKTF